MSSSEYITAGVKIEVKPIFRKDVSNPELNSHIYNYKVVITNENKYPIQLLSRKWIINDSLQKIEVIKGEGVIGKQPVIFGDEIYEYISAAEIKGFLGQMEGSYTFLNKWDNTYFTAQIPAFNLQFPPTCN